MDHIFKKRPWLLGLLLLPIIAGFTGTMRAQPTTPPPTVTISDPSPTIAAAQPVLTAVLDGPSQMWRFKLAVDSIGFTEAKIKWQFSDTTEATIFAQAVIPTTNGAIAREWSAPQQLFFGTGRVSAIRQFTDGSTVDTFTINFSMAAADEGEIRCGAQPLSYGCIVSGPKTSPKETKVHWQSGLNDGSAPAATDLDPGKIYQLPGNLNDKTFRVSASGILSGTVVWGPMSIDLHAKWWAGSLYLPEIHAQRADQNPPPTSPTPTPPPSSPTPTPQPNPITFNFDAATNLVSPNLNGNVAGNFWRWCIQNDSWSQPGCTPIVDAGSLLNVSQNASGHYLVRLESFQDQAGTQLNWTGTGEFTKP